MLGLKLILPLFSFFFRGYSFLISQIRFGTFFYLLHRKDATYLNKSNRFIGKMMLRSSLIFLIFAVIPSISLLVIFWPWLLINVLLIPLYFELTWQHTMKISHQ